MNRHNQDHLPENPGDDWKGIYFPELRDVSSPATIRVARGPFGNARLASSRDLAELLTAAEKYPDNYLRLLQAYAIVHDPKVDIFATDALPVPLGIDSPNLVVVGRSGGGKSHKGSFPAAAHAIAAGWGLICLVNKGKWQTRLLRRIARAHGREEDVQLLAPRKPERTLGWTGLEGCRDLSTAGEVAAAMVASAARKSRSGDGAWAYNQAQEWIQHAIHAICTDLTRAFHTLVELRKVVLAGDYKAFADEHPDFPVLKKFARYEEGGNRNTETVASTIGEATAFIDDVAPFLSKGELSLETFVAKGGILVIEVDEYDVQRLQPLVTLLLGRLIATMQRHACDSPTGRLPHKFLVNIDELAAAGPVPGIVRALHTCRERNYCFVAGLQSVAQLPAIYEADADAVLAGFQSQIVLAGGIDMATADYFSRRTGASTIAVPSLLHGPEQNEGPVAMAHSWQMSSRPLLLPTDIASPERHPLLGMPATVLMGDGVTPPFQAYLTAAHEVGYYARMMDEVSSQTGDDDLRRRRLTVRRQKPADKSQQPLRPGFSDTTGWTISQIRSRIEKAKEAIDWANTKDNARKWWLAFEKENESKPRLVLRLAEELAVRKSTISEFFRAFAMSSTDNIQAVIFYLDYSRAKLQCEEEKKILRRASVRATPTGSDAVRAPYCSIPVKPEED
jgi:hypothetical protein